MFNFNKNGIHVVKYRVLWMCLSAVLLIPGIVAMIYSMMTYPTHSPVRVGIDYTGGSILQYETSANVEHKDVGTIQTNLTKAGVPSVIFSSHDSGALIERAMSSDVGAKGFVSKLSDEKMLLDAIYTVAEGKSFVQPDLVSAFMEMASLFSVLTKREMQVVKLIQDGFPNEEIAAKLQIKLSTLENYISLIYDKIGCRDRNSLLEKLR